MYTIQDAEHLKEVYKNDPLFDADKNYLTILFQDFDKDMLDEMPPYEMRKLFDEVIAIAVKNKWSRRRLCFMLKCILKDNSNFSENTEELIFGLLGNLGGEYSKPETAVKLYKDPDDMKKLSEYINSNDWVYNEYYIEE
jgi:hypothetical protein